MNLKLESRVKMDFLSVKSGFDRHLFEQLNPPFPRVKLLRFDGSRAGDVVSLQLDFLFFKQKWTSLISEDRTDEREFFFVDQGKELPFFLKEWKHTHRVIQRDQHSLIVDDIQFKTPFIWMDFLLYPLMWMQFAARKPVYQRLFGKA